MILYSKLGWNKSEQKFIETSNRRQRKLFSPMAGVPPTEAAMKALSKAKVAGVMVAGEIGVPSNGWWK